MEFRLTIDNRETALISEVKKIIPLPVFPDSNHKWPADIQKIAENLSNSQTIIGVERGKKFVIVVVVDQLPLGDIILSTPQNKNAVIFERKTIADLLQSHNDGRYEEQIFRLNGQGTPNHNICFVVEGNPYATHSNRSHNSNGKQQYKRKYGGGGKQNTAAGSNKKLIVSGKCAMMPMNFGNSSLSTTSTLPVAPVAPLDASNSESMQPLLPRPTNLSAISSMFSLQYFKGFSVVRTNNTVESAWYICTAIRKLAGHPERVAYTDISTTHSQNTAAAAPILDINTGNITAETVNVEDNHQQCANGLADSFTSVVSKIKSANISRDNMLEILLAQIPKISAVSARAIAAKFHTMTALLAALPDPTCLNDVRVGKPGQMKKINKNIYSSLVHYMQIDASLKK